MTSIVHTTSKSLDYPLVDDRPCVLKSRGRKKQEKKDAAMRSSLEIGDQVTTIGGVIGRVVAIKDDTFVLETGADRVKIRFTKSAISSVEKLNMDKAPADKK